MNYRQCRLQKEKTSTISFIPEKYAILGKTLKLKNDDVWDNGWVVMEVSSTSVKEEHLPNYHKDIKGHRKATGDALSKQT